jgi:hypothetical protein
MEATVQYEAEDIAINFTEGSEENRLRTGGVDRNEDIETVCSHLISDTTVDNLVKAGIWFLSLRGYRDFDPTER